MLESIMIVTNNPLSRCKFGEKHSIEFIDGTVMEVFSKVRDFVHSGHRVLTHPLMSSIKPNETPYRTVVITKVKGSSVDMDSLNIIESAILTTEKFMRDFRTPNWKEDVLRDFQLIDYDLVYHALY